MRRLGWSATLFLVAGSAVAGWPDALPDDVPRTASRKRGRPADPVNVALVGTAADLDAAFRAAGWLPADRGTVMRHARSGVAFLLGRPYRRAPVSPLYLRGRRQDVAYQRDVDRSVKRRHHVRFWLSEVVHADGRPVWIGSATYDWRLKLSLMHKIAPDVDVERDRMLDMLDAAGVIGSRRWLEGRGEVKEARNGSGDWYFTDGRVAVAELRPVR